MKSKNKLLLGCLRKPIWVYIILAGTIYYYVTDNAFYLDCRRIHPHSKLDKKQIFNATRMKSAIYRPLGSIFSVRRSGKKFHDSLKEVNRHAIGNGSQIHANNYDNSKKKNRNSAKEKQGNEGKKDKTDFGKFEGPSIFSKLNTFGAPIIGLSRTTVSGISSQINYFLGHNGERLSQQVSANSKKVEETVHEVKHEFDKLIHGFTSMQEDFVSSMITMQRNLTDLAMTEYGERRQYFANSLKEFKHNYDEKIEHLLPPQTSHELSQFTKKDLRLRQEIIDDKHRQFLTLMSHIAEEINSQRYKALQSGGKLKKFGAKSLRERMKIFESFPFIPWPFTEKKEMDLDEILQDLKKKLSDLSDFMKERNRIENVFDNLKEKIQQSNELYDEIVARTQSKLYYDKLNDKVLKRILDCLDEDEEQGWELVSSPNAGNGPLVHRKNLPSIDGHFSKYCCVKATGIMNAKYQDILDLFDDNDRITEYNSFYTQGADLETIDDSTKVVWCASPAMFLYKARDFVTVVHIRSLGDGTVCIINRSVSHPLAPADGNGVVSDKILRQNGKCSSKERTDNNKGGKYIRGEIIMGANIIQPIEGTPNKTKFTLVTQVNPGGFAPSWIVNKLTTMGPSSFFRDVEKAANRKK